MANQAEENKRKQRFLLRNGVNVKVDGSWGPWQQAQYEKLTTKEKPYQTTPLGLLSFAFDKLTGNSTYQEDPPEVKGYDGEIKSDDRSDTRRWIDQQMSNNRTPLGYVTQTVLPTGAVAAAVTYGAPVLYNAVTKGAPFIYNGIRTAASNPSTIYPTLKTGIQTGLRLGKQFGKELVKGVVGMGAVNAATKATTGKTWGEQVSQSTGVSPEFGEILNPGAYAPTYLKNVAKRGVETVMRTSGSADPVQPLVEGMKEIITHDPKRAASIGNYILTGTRLGNKGYYNSFSDDPEAYYYTGFFSTPNAPYQSLAENDLIDAFLYKKPISSKFGMKKLDTKDYGVHTDYVKKYYPDKDIQVYETLPSSRIIQVEEVPEVPLIKKIEGSNNAQLFVTQEGFIPNVAGHLEEYSYDLTGHNMVRGQDIWKFNPKEYMEKWMSFPNKPQKLLYKLGLKAVDNLGTPVITRTKWINKHTSDQELLKQRAALGLPDIIESPSTLPKQIKAKDPRFRGKPTPALFPYG